MQRGISLYRALNLSFPSLSFPSLSFPFLSFPFSAEVGWIPAQAEEIMLQHPIFRAPVWSHKSPLHSAALSSALSVTDLSTCVISLLLLNLTVVTSGLISFSSLWNLSHLLIWVLWWTYNMKWKTFVTTLDYIGYWIIFVKYALLWRNTK